mgnify:CR=1 FL=1
MSWPIVATIASTAFSAVQQYKSQKAMAAFGQAEAELESMVAKDNAAMAKLQGAEQELDRMREFEEARNYNLNISQVDLALKKQNLKTRDTDVSRIQLQSLANQRNFLLGAHSADVKNDSFRYMGSQAAFAAGGNLLKGAVKTATLLTPRTPTAPTTAPAPAPRPVSRPATSPSSSRINAPSGGI